MGGEAGLYGPGSVSWQVNRETTVLFGGVRAMLLQAAHPLVVAGARQTGLYRREPWKRLERTLQLSYTITFGTEAEARAVAEHINRVHAEVHGRDEVTGLRYDALDPDLLLWVHAALIDSALLFERLTVGALDDEGRQRYHREAMAGVELLGLPRERIPPTVPALRAYIDEVIASGILDATTDGARAVATLIRHPPPDTPWRPLLRLLAEWGFGTLPPPLRAGYGVRWNPLREAWLRSSLLGLRAIRRLLPSRVRLIVPARLAERRVASERAA
ncbi:MAG TPA: oxygenase MpaB family protein [Actinomycetota bacterium]|nr:oxygenase MpaB family protein [Actinomycetota bacterium]